MTTVREPLERTRRVAPTLYVLILVGAMLLLGLNGDLWLALILLAWNVAMIAAIVYVARRPKDDWDGPKLRKPVK